MILGGFTDSPPCTLLDEPRPRLRTSRGLPKSKQVEDKVVRAKFPAIRACPRENGSGGSVSCTSDA